jgi:lysyl-tRNA synthetase class 1
MSETNDSKYWLDLAVAEIIEHYPEGTIVVSSGISPSASYHIGHFREILTADALTWGLRKSGRQAIHKHVVDNFDPLRKRYDFLPESYEQYVGWPICLVPDPFDECRTEHKTYAEHFYKEFEGYARQMVIVPDEVVRSYEDLYANGKMAPQIEKVMAHVDDIRQVFKDVSKRDLPEDWTPLQVMAKDNTFHNAAVADYKDGQIEGIALDSGKVKLNWRLDWPARWQILGVQVEPFSAQEHGAAGGSYDTAVRFAKEVYGFEPPIPGVRYANVHMVGDNKKMSSSKGNLVTPEQALAIMPPEVLRYFVVRSKPDRTLFFDSGLGFYNLVDEYSKIAAGESSEFKEAYQFASANAEKLAIAPIPFNHLVSTYQTARGDMTQIKEILRRTGHEFDETVLEREIPYVKNWLNNYAPESVKFIVQEKLPTAELTNTQKIFLSTLADAVAAKTLDGQAMHDAIYEAKETAGLKPNEAFQALYRVILGQDSGPKAGWFLASLDQEWLAKRLKLEA